MKQTATDTDAFSYRRRLNTFTRRLPANLRRVFSSYLERRSLSGTLSFRSAEGKYTQPFWMYLPFWITDGARNVAAIDTVRHAAVGDLLWAQTCLFYVFRLQDDVFDDPAMPSELMFVANIFLDEAIAVFSRYFAAAHPFWDVFHTALRGSSEAMIALRVAEREPDHPLPSHSRCIRAINAILLLSSHAASALLPHPMNPRHIDAYGGAMGQAGQLIDDLTDLDEDLRSGRINLAARMIAWKEFPGSVEERREAILSADRTQVILRIISHYRKASRAAGHFANPGPELYARQCIEWTKQSMRSNTTEHPLQQVHKRAAPWSI
jgi:hypothetical protein